MSFQTARHCACKITLAAFVQLFSTVRFQMPPQGTWIRAAKVTLVAFVWLLSRVCLQMCPQVPCIRWRKVTLVAFVCLCNAAVFLSFWLYQFFNQFFYLNFQNRFVMGTLQLLFVFIHLSFQMIVCLIFTSLLLAIVCTAIVCLFVFSKRKIWLHTWQRLLSDWRQIYLVDEGRYQRETWTVCFFSSTKTIFGLIFLRTKVRKTRQNRFRHKKCVYGKITPPIYHSKNCHMFSDLCHRCHRY